MASMHLRLLDRFLSSLFFYKTKRQLQNYVVYFFSSTGVAEKKHLDNQPLDLVY